MEGHKTPPNVYPVSFYGTKTLVCWGHSHNTIAIRALGKPFGTGVREEKEPSTPGGGAGIHSRPRTACLVQATAINRTRLRFNTDAGIISQGI